MAHDPSAHGVGFATATPDPTAEVAVRSILPPATWSR